MPDAAAVSDETLTFVLESAPRLRLKAVARVLALVGFLALFGYSLTRAWVVLGELGHVKLVDLRNVLEVVTVRDAILCVVGYRLGSDLLQAALRARRRD
jgi:hypothetical protein